MRKKITLAIILGIVTPIVLYALFAFGAWDIAWPTRSGDSALFARVWFVALVSIVEVFAISLSLGVDL